MHSYTINDKSYTGEKFCGTLNFIIQLRGFAFDKKEKQYFAIYW